jgi:hypothetical protein
MSGRKVKSTVAGCAQRRGRPRLADQVGISISRRFALPFTTVRNQRSRHKRGVDLSGTAELFEGTIMTALRPISVVESRFAAS